MRKYHADLNDNTMRRKRSWVPRAIVLILVLLIAPLVYEGGQIVVSRWMSMAGAHREPQTPVLNAITVWSQATDAEVQRYSHHYFSSGSWKPSTAIPLAIAWAVVMSLVFLRRTQ